MAALEIEAAMRRALLLAITLILLGTPLGRVEGVAAAPAGYHPLPTAGDFSLSFPPEWSPFAPRPGDALPGWTLLAAYQSPTLNQAGDVAGVYVNVLHVGFGATSVDLTPNPPTVLIEGRNGCLLNGVSGLLCGRYVVAYPEARTRALHYIIVKNGIAWHLVAITTQSVFDQQRASLEAVVLTFHTAYSDPCSFRLGFETLHALIPGIVGDCTENEDQDRGTGNTIQATTSGLLVYRKTDNWTAFTDGGTTWINGPYGLQSRPNDRRFCWEPDVNQADCAALEEPEPEPQPDPAPPAGTSLNLSALDGWATLVAEDGTYLGLVSSSQVSLDSICNPVGQYGSRVGLYSIRNSAGRYGGPTALYRPYNAFSIHPPAIVYRNNVVGYLSKNPSVRNAVDPDYLFATYGCS